jgi:hypothetical protein
MPLDQHKRKNKSILDIYSVCSHPVRMTTGESNEMAQAAFAYDVPFPESRRRSGDATVLPQEMRVMTARLPLTLSIFADRATVRDELVEDGEVAGFGIAASEEVGALLDEAARPLGDIVLLDCPSVDGAELAAMARLDLRAARSGAQLVISTTAAALDEVFACMDQSDPLILVDPTRAERAVALGEALARVSGVRLRELSDVERLAVLRLTEQVGQIAQRLERLAYPGMLPGGGRGSANVLPFESHGERVRAAQPGYRFEQGAREDAPGLPDPRLIRTMIRQRQLRGRFLDPELFADPAWDILLDLTAAAAEKVHVSVSSLCIAAMVPPTTALRWIRQMTDAGLLARIEDHSDRRRAFIVLTERSRSAMAAYFGALGDVPAVAI